jgi:hypothetical protein
LREQDADQKFVDKIVSGLFRTYSFHQHWQPPFMAPLILVKIDPTREDCSVVQVSRSTMIPRRQRIIMCQYSGLRQRNLDTRLSNLTLDGNTFEQRQY